MKKTKPRSQPTVAVVLPYYAQQANEVARGVTRFGRASGRLQLRDAPFVSHHEIPKWLARLRPDGAITWLSPCDFEEIRGEIPPGLPMVNVGSDPLGPEIGGVCSSDQEMMDLIHKHLSEAGYERFAFAGLGKSATMQRRLAMLRNKSGRGSAVECCDVSSMKYDEATQPKSTRALERWLRTLRPPVGIIAWSGFHAQCLCAACRVLGLNVPRDVGVLSISDDRWGIFSDPPISAVCADGDGLGYAAMKLLVAKLRGRRIPEQLVQIAPREVIARGSAERERDRTEHIANAVGYIDQHAFEGIGVDDVIRTTQLVSRRKFYDDFAAQVGCSPADYIRRVKMVRAKELLATTMSIKRIALACGFQNVPRLYDAFTRSEGETPVAFRRKHGERRK